MLDDTHTDANVISINCSRTDDSWHARGAAGITCLLITFILLCELLCDHRAYKTTLQRLILYYTILSIVYQIINSVNGMAHNHSPPSRGDLTPLENAAMYFANVAFFLPAIIINYLMSLILRLCCGCHMTYPQSKLSTFFTELVCITLGLLLSLMWIPVNTIGDCKHFSFDIYYTVYASGCQDNRIIISDPESIIAVSVSAVVILEMVAAVIVLNIAHCKVRLQVRGQQVLALERRTHIIVIAIALIYIIGITVSFPFCLLEDDISVNWNKSEIFLAIWFPLLNQCNLFILYVASIRTTNHPLCLQRKKAQSTALSDKKHLTNPSSHPLNQPSHTTFPIRYTGGFTNITETSGVYCDDTSSTGEMIPLLRAGKHESSTCTYSRSAQTDSV